MTSYQCFKQVNQRKHIMRGSNSGNRSTRVRFLIDEQGKKHLERRKREEVEHFIDTASTFQL